MVWWSIIVAKIYGFIALHTFNVFFYFIMNHYAHFMASIRTYLQQQIDEIFLCFNDIYHQSSILYLKLTESYNHNFIIHEE